MFYLCLCLDHFPAPPRPPSPPEACMAPSASFCHHYCEAVPEHTLPQLPILLVICPCNFNHLLITLYNLITYLLFALAWKLPESRDLVNFVNDSPAPRTMSRAQ